jgi:hypothetical protein
MRNILDLKQIILLFLLAYSSLLMAQKAVINGKLVDAATNEPLIYANVFLNNTTIGSVTNQVGEFSIKDISFPAVYEIVFSYVGYESYKQKISIVDENIAMGVLKLKPIAVELNAVEVKATKDKEWEKKLKRFEKIFLGEDKFADLCTIINPYSIDFADTEKKFVANSSSPIEIENRALGYRIHFALNKFESAKTDYAIEGNVRFEELVSFEKNEKAKWLSNRQKSYLNSRQHLFKSLIEKKITAEGFELYTEKEGVSTANRAPVFSSNLETILLPCDTLAMVSNTQYKDIYKVSFKGRMEIHYIPGESFTKVYKDITHPISWVWLNKPFILVTKDGVELNPSEVSVSGNMSANRVSHLMPLDYVPLPSNKIESKSKANLAVVPLEKIYIHTDKPYYYPGEIIWFKGYVNYNATAADTLSKTAYVELIRTENKSIAISKIMAIDSGYFQGELTLPDSLKTGNYMLRSYTSWNRNFKDSEFFTKSVPVLKLKENVETSVSKPPSSNDKLVIHSEKTTYSANEKVYLILKIKDEINKDANLSVSVTDESLVTPMETSSIISGSKINMTGLTPRKKYAYPIERGISYTGRFFNDSYAPEKASLSVVQMNPNNFYFSESDDNGFFKIEDLQFTDTCYFSIRSANKRGELFGKAELIKRDVPAITTVVEMPSIKLTATPTVMRRKSIFDSEDAQLLEEVVIKDRKEEPIEKKRPYGKSNYVLERKDINTNYPNLLYAIQGKFPGLIVREVNNPGAGPEWMVYTTRAATSSIINVKEVAVLVNDVYTGGTPASILSAINPDDVASIELKTSLSSSTLYGSAGSSGVLSVYTNKAPEITRPASIPTIKVPGYSTSKKFKLPETTPTTLHASRNNSSLIYWNPLVKTDKDGNAVVAFTTGDLQTKYRVIVEGLDGKSEPIHEEYIVTISEK